MNTSGEGSDKELDDLIRAASDRDTDEGAILNAVIHRIDAAEKPRFQWLQSFGPGSAMAGFAALLLIAGIAGYQLPQHALSGSDHDILLLALGEPGGFGGVLSTTGNVE